MKFFSFIFVVFLVSVCFAQTINEEDFMNFMTKSERIEPIVKEKKEKGRLSAHVKILTETFEGTSKERWENRSAIDTVFCANLATDLATIRKDWGLVSDAIACFYAVKEFSDVYKNARNLTNQVQKFASSAKFQHGGGQGDYVYGVDCFHFDDLFTYDEVKNRWKEFEDWAKDETKKTQKSMYYWQNQGGRTDFLIIMGMTSHAVQDFYCHSNYAQLLKMIRPYDSSNSLPIYDELNNEETAKQFDHYSSIFECLLKSNKTLTSEQEYRKNELGGLQTGNWGFRGQIYDREQSRYETPWKHRDDTQPLVMELAARATDFWKEKLISWLDKEYRDDLRKHLGLPPIVEKIELTSQKPTVEQISSNKPIIETTNKPIIETTTLTEQSSLPTYQIGNVNSFQDLLKNILAYTQKNSLATDWNIEMSLIPFQKEFSIGSSFDIKIVPNQNGYLFVFNVTEHGNIVMLFPNEEFTSNGVEANQKIYIPVEISPPTGREYMVAYLVQKNLFQGSSYHKIEGNCVENILATQLVKDMNTQLTQIAQKNNSNSSTTSEKVSGFVSKQTKWTKAIVMYQTK